MADETTRTFGKESGCLRNEKVGKQWVLSAVEHLSTSRDCGKVGNAIDQAVQGKIPWGMIFVTIMPFIIQAFTTGTLDVQALIAAIMALLHPPVAHGPTPGV